uniref:Uncharacterized protein n=1 Tax=Utricularia reniformis TaxID=192314 RepID=A0A1Y0B469_9LAMI|nr:hypothetical protein AEK19_MT2025 [Utricularia reniformis]ART32184.1 hypothetical protein AEK19_MT2025 [Utricularia reniformis]
MTGNLPMGLSLMLLRPKLSNTGELSTTICQVPRSLPRGTIIDGG